MDDPLNISMGFWGMATIAVFVFIFITSGIRIMKEYERAVVYTLGRFTSIKGPGLIIIIPVLQQAVKVDMRVNVLDVPPQDVISKDNVSVRVNAVVYYKVVDSFKAINEISHFHEATSQLAQTTLRSILGQHELDEMLSERDKMNADLQKILDSQTENWGVKISNVEIKQVDLDESMIRAIAKQAEAERIRRARVIDAEGEFQAAEKLKQAAGLFKGNPEAMQLRYLSTLSSIADEKSSTIVFPFPTKGLEKIFGQS